MMSEPAKESTPQTEEGRLGGRSSQVGVRLIAIYKLAKAGVQLALAGVLLILLAKGLTTELHDFATRLAKNAASAWSVALAGALVRVTTKTGVYLTTAALAADAGLSFLEGWSLYRRFWWAPWLIVIATGTLLPFEFVHIMRRPHLGRVLLFAANLAIVAYLARRAVHEVRRQRFPGGEH